MTTNLISDANMLYPSKEQLDAIYRKYGTNLTAFFEDAKAAAKARADQRVHQQSDGEPSLEDLAIQAADYLQKLDEEQAGYISFALRQKIADTRAHSPVVVAKPEGDQP